MTDIQIRQATLTPALGDTLASVLASAFANDRAMNAMLGQEKWHDIAERYFAAQFSFSDVILVAEQDGEVLGALLARSPSAGTTWQGFWLLLVMMRLLGRHYLESQRVGYALLQRLPARSHWYINQLAVRPEYQAKGIGRRLLARLASQTGNELVCVDCEDDLQSYYESAGFTLFDVVPDHHLRIMANHDL